jgi:Cu-Zn family superoxide dismutase
MKAQHLVSLCVAIGFLSACGQREPTAPATPATASAPPPPAETPPAASVSAQLSPTQGNTANGTLTLTADGETVRVSGSLQGLKPNGEFGFHIHENGDCSAPDASSAGGHFNPTNAQHGDPQSATHHGGDMLNVKSDAQGAAQVEVVASGVSLTTGQPDDVHGKAIVLHEKRDDYQTQPSGDSGKRIACGVISTN